MDQASRNNAIARHLTVKYLLTLGLLGGTAFVNYLILRTQMAARARCMDVPVQDTTPFTAHPPRKRRPL